MVTYWLKIRNLEGDREGPKMTKPGGNRVISSTDLSIKSYIVKLQLYGRNSNFTQLRRAD